MTAVRISHDRRARSRVTMVPVDDGRPTGKVLPMTPAPDGIELRHLRAFVAVAEELNFGRAATRLYVSQPALSRQIRALEQLIGCDLLRRSTHRVELTVAGESLLERSRTLLHEVDDAVTATRSVGGELEGRLSRIWEPIVDLTTAGPDLQTLRNACEDLHAQFPVPEVGVRHVNAGGVPSLMVAPREGQDVTLLLLHGGGYVMGSAFGYRHLAGALALAADATALVPEYRLAPEHPFPAALEDALRAYQWVLCSGTAPEQLTLAGDSAGAGLVLSLVLTLKQQGLPLPGGLVMLCPGLRLTFDDDLEMQTGSQPGVSVEQLRSFAESYLDGHPADDPILDPLGADLTGLPPMLVQGGTGDVIVEDAHLLAEHARRHGVDVRLELYPVDTHDFQIFWSFLPEAAEAVQQAGHFASGIREAADAPRTASRAR
jgi:epsilon-lactone hydrolase